MLGATDALEKDHDRLRMRNQQFKEKCEGQRVLSAKKETLTCSQEAEKDEDQVHN